MMSATKLAINWIGLCVVAYVFCCFFLKIDPKEVVLALGGGLVGFVSGHAQGYISGKAAANAEKVNKDEQPTG